MLRMHLFKNGFLKRVLFFLSHQDMERMKKDYWELFALPFCTIAPSGHEAPSEQRFQ
jgi:hypothetical protein